MTGAARDSKPPRCIYRLLERVLPPGSEGETILGDLQQEYEAFRPRWLRAIWYSAVALRLAAGFVIASEGLRGLDSSNDRDHGLGTWFDAMIQDVRQGTRGLCRSPSYTTIAVLTLALGIGVSAAVAGIIYDSLMRPLPYREPERLLRIADRKPDSSPDSMSSMSMANFRDLRARARSFEGLVGYQHWWFNVSSDVRGSADEAPVPRRVSGLRVEPGFFALLGVTPAIGRRFVAEDASPGAPPVVIVGDGLWRSWFGADPSIVGKTVRLDLVPRVVVGVLPAGFAFLRDPQVVIPLPIADRTFERRIQRSIDGIGRLASGIEPGAGLAELQAIFDDLASEFPEENGGWTVTGVSMHEWRVRGGRSQLWMFGGAVALVLVIACANVSGLTLVRSETRRHELGIRAALGAGRGRLARLLIIEALQVALLAGLLGAVLAGWTTKLIVAHYGSTIPRAEEITVSVVVVALAIGLSMVVGLVVGAVPALQLRPGRIQSALGHGGRSAGGSSRLREALVVTEVALAVVLVAGAGLLINSVWRLSRVDLGVEADGVLTFALGLPGARYPSAENLTTFWDGLVADLSTLPGVEAVGMSTRTPLFGGTNGPMVVGDAGDSSASMVEARAVTPGYFRAVGMRLLAGRTLTGADRRPGSAAVVVNEAFVRALLDDVEQTDPAARERQLRVALGKILRPTWLEDRFEIVGVVSDVRDFGPTEPPRPTAYWPVGSPSSPFGASAYLTAAVRVAGDALRVLPAARERLRALDPDVPMVDITTLADLSVQRLGGNRRSALSLLGAFATFGLGLGAIGIYGVMSFAVARRTRELGVRKALGATDDSLLRLVLTTGIRLTGIGLAIGLLTSLASGRLLASLLYGVTPADPSSMAAVVVVLLATGLLACWVPARRAARVEVIEALRSE